MQKASRSAGSSSKRARWIHNVSLFLLTMAVELVEPIGDFASANRILYAEEFDDVAGHVHAAGGVDARSDTKSDFPRSERPTTELCDFQYAP